MTTTGPNTAGTVAEDASFGTATWANVTNTTSSNNSYAATSEFSSGQSPTRYIKLTNFGFSIADTQIDGIQVDVERKSSRATVKDSVVKLVIGGTVSGSNLADATNWPGSDTNKTYGGATTLWGLTPSVADVNGSGFGVVISVAWVSGIGKANSAQGQIDLVTITITSSTGGGGGQPISKRFGGIPFMGSQPLQGQQRWIKRVSGLLTPSNEWRPAHGIR